jgi:hypothetical protein
VLQKCYQHEHQDEISDIRERHQHNLRKGLTSKLSGVMLRYVMICHVTVICVGSYGTNRTFISARRDVEKFRSFKMRSKRKVRKTDRTPFPVDRSSTVEIHT